MPQPATPEPTVAAGDGSESTYQRIRTGQFEKVTVAESLNLQGWQLVDELNRAIAGEKWSGYLSPLHVVKADNVEFDAAPSSCSLKTDDHVAMALLEFVTVQRGA